MLAHLGFQRPFQHRFGELLEQPVLPDDILGFLVVSEQLIDQLLVDCHGPFILLSPMAIYTVLFTPSKTHLSLDRQVHRPRESLLLLLRRRGLWALFPEV